MLYQNVCSTDVPRDLESPLWFYSQSYRQTSIWEYHLKPEWNNEVIDLLRQHYNHEISNILKIIIFMNVII